MPLFAISDNTTYITNYNKFKSCGFPLMFMPQNKHIYFGSPHANTCYNFSCAELSLNDNANTNEGDLNVNSSSKQFVSGISVDDHKITCSYNSITLPKSELTLSKTSNAYTAITGTFESLTSYLLLIEKSDNSNNVTSKIELRTRNLLSSYSTSNNEINLNVDYNTFDANNIQPVAFHLNPTENNICDSANTCQTLYDTTYWYKWNSMTSISQETEFNPFVFIIYNGKLDSIKIKLIFKNFNRNTPFTLKFTVNDRQRTFTVRPNSNSYEYSFSINNINATLDFGIGCTVNSLPDNAYVLMQIRNVNNVDINNNIPALHANIYGDITHVYTTYFYVKYVLNSGIKLTSSHGDYFNLISKTQTYGTPTQYGERNSDGIIFVKNDNIKNAVLAYSYHSTKSTNTTVSYIPKKISYDMFGHVTGITKTGAGIQDIISLTQAQYDSLSSKDPYTLYLITS